MEAPLEIDDDHKHHDKDEHGHEEEDLAKPVKLLEWMLPRPKQAFCTFCGGFCFWFLLVLIFLLAGLDVIPFSSSVPLYLRDHVTRQRDDMFYVGTETADVAYVETDTVEERSVVSVSLSLIYEVTEDAGSTIFLEDYVKSIQEIEDYIKAADLYDDYCALGNSTFTGLRDCLRETSCINFFDTGYIDPNNLSFSLYFDSIAEVDPILEQATMDEILTAWAAFNATEAQETYGVSFAPIWTVTDSEFGNDGQITSLASRASFFFGLPLPGYDSDSDRADEQIATIETWLYETFDSYLMSQSNDNFNVYFFNSGMFEHHIQAQLLSSGSLLVLAMVFVWAYLCYMNKSMWIGTMGIGQIFMSSFPAIIIYRYVFQQQYFGTFNVLSIFIILGIGADDIFVFMDTFALSRSMVGDSFAKRLFFTYRRAGGAMLVTSVTTAFAFLSNATSEFPAVYTFGIFSALLVIINYIGMITFFPALVILKEKVLNHTTCNTHCDKACPCCVREESNDAHEMGKFEMFFNGRFFDTMERYKLWIVLVFTIVLGVFLGFAVQLETDPDSPQLLPDSDNYQAYSTVFAEHFERVSTSESSATIFFVFGIESIDRTGTNPTNEDDKGEVVFDDAFGATPLDEESQEWLIELCDAIGTVSDERYVGVDANVDCWLYDFRDWLDTTTVNGFPVNDSHCTTEEVAAAGSCLSQRLFEWFFTVFYDEDDLAFTTYYSKWKPFLYGEEVDGTNVPRFMYLAVETEFPFASQYQDGIAFYEVWETWMDAEMTSVPSENLESGFQLSYVIYHYWHLQQQLLREMLVGITISLTLAFVVITIATSNAIVAALATFIILCIVICVFGFTVMMGWKLGILESINLILVPGLAVDYVVHLAEAYLESPKSDRPGKVRDMLTHVGVSIVSGAMSTLGSAFFMFFATITFFQKFAAFIFCTILTSSLMSTMLFSCLLLFIGPTGNHHNGHTGDVHIIKFCSDGFNKCFRKKTE